MCINSESEGMHTYLTNITNGIGGIVVVQIFLENDVEKLASTTKRNIGMK